MTETPLKRCSKKDKCSHPDAKDGWLPETSDYFGKHKGLRNGLEYICRVCERQYARQQYAANPDKGRERARHRRAENPERAREISHRYEITHAEKRRTKSAHWRETHRQEIHEYNIRRYAETAEARRERGRRFYADHIHERRAYHRRYRETHAQERRRYREKHPDIMRAGKQRRRARKLALPSTFTAADWNRALEYFNGCCAYCGNNQGVIEADHFVPLYADKCEGTTPTNMLPACRSCNRRKSKRLPLDFLEVEFGKRHALEIMKRIEGYFEIVAV